MTPDWDVVVVGGGPAGLLAAGRAAMLGARTLLLEKMEKPARKLRISGKGRANITNMRPLEDHLQEIHPEPRFLRQAFQAFFSEDLVALLREAGVATTVERGDRVFPTSGRAWDVAEALGAWARHQGAELRMRTRVVRLLVDSGCLKGLAIQHGSGHEQSLTARCVVLATGGQSYPATGSTGDGYHLAAATGHHVTPLRPSLVSLATRPAYPQAAGLSLRNVGLTLWIDHRKQGAEFGEALVTERGLGGPAVLRLSRRIVDALARGQVVTLSVDLKPALDPGQLEARLLRVLEDPKRATCGDVLRSLLPAPLVAVFTGLLGLGPSQPAARLDASRRRRLVALLKDLRLDVTGHGGWEEAIVTAGGVDLREVDPRTLGSRKLGQLFFAGEVLDLDANTGGYNLQIAFSTGWLAGGSAARASLGIGTGSSAPPVGLPLGPVQDESEDGP